MITDYEYRLKILKEFLDDQRNWKPPSYTKIMKHVGWKSKNSVRMALKKLKFKL